MLAKIFNFGTSVLGCIIILSIYDNAEPALQNYLRRRRSIGVTTTTTIHYKEEDRGLAEAEEVQGIDSSTIAIDTIIISDSGSTTGCGQYTNEVACSMNSDSRGNGCRWCTDHLSNKICVGEDSVGYKFAPCNNWLCYDPQDPAKSDALSCERVW